MIGGSSTTATSLSGLVDESMIMPAGFPERPR
jgi:hypothetical protein